MLSSFLLSGLVIIALALVGIWLSKERDTGTKPACRDRQAKREQWRDRQAEHAEWRDTSRHG